MLPAVGPARSPPRPPGLLALDVHACHGATCRGNTFASAASPASCRRRTCGGRPKLWGWQHAPRSRTARSVVGWHGVCCEPPPPSRTAAGAASASASKSRPRRALSGRFAAVTGRVATAAAATIMFTQVAFGAPRLSAQAFRPGFPPGRHTLPACAAAPAVGQRQPLERGTVVSHGGQVVRSHGPAYHQLPDASP
jgi:hypothetical protein